MKRNLVPTFILENLANKNMHGHFFGYVISGDIVNFTPQIEEMMKSGKSGAECVGKMLNSTFGKVTDIVYENRGFITNFAGDAFTAIFNNEPKAENILSIGQEIINIFSQYNAKSKKGKLHIRIGISSGVIEWGITGSIGLAYYFRGDGINSAVNIQHIGEYDTLQFDKNFLNLLGKETKVYEKGSYFFIKDKIEVRKKEPVRKKYKNENDKFYPKILSELRSEGEFRNVIPVFIRFPFNVAYGELEKLSSTILSFSKKFNGYLNKIDFGDKGGICLVIFGAPYTDEDMVERAIMFSISLKEELKESNISIGIDYGVSYTGFLGSSYWQEYTVIGDIVNTSARLALYKENIILVSSRIKSESEDFDFKSIGEISLKGKSKPVEICTVARKKQTFKGDFISPFVGRTSENTEIQRFISKQIKNRTIGFVNIIGESGTGKTRLSFESVTRSKIKYLYTNADPIIKEPMFPLKFLISNIISFNLFDPDAKKREMIDSYCDKHFLSECGRFKLFLKYFFLQEESSSIKSMSGKEKLEGVFFILKETLFEHAHNAPFAFIFDDAMWMDDDTVDFIKYLSSQNYSNSILLFFLFREENVITKKLNLISKEKITVRLDNFDEEGSRQFIEQFFKQTVSDELVSILKNKSEGNPLFLEQLSLHLVDNNLVVFDKDKLSLINTDYEIPSNIDRLIVSRLDSLSAVTRNGIQKAAVIGKEFEILLLKHLIDEKSLPIVLSEGEKNKIISLLSNQTAFFRHILLYEIAYKMQFENTLKKLHKQIGMLYEKLFEENLIPYYETLYYHFKKSGSKGKAIFYLRNAIEKDIKSYANESALKFIDEYLAVNKSASDRIEMLLKKGEILRHIGRYDDGIELYGKIISIRKIKESEKANSLRGLGEALWAMGKYDDALLEYEKAFKIFEKMDDAAGISDIHEKRGMVYYNKGDYKTATEEFRSALKYSAKNKTRRFSIMSNLGLVLFRQGEYDKAMSYYTRSLQNSKKSGNLNEQALFLLRIGLIYFEQSKYKTALEYYFLALEINQKIGNRRNEGVTLGNIGTVYNDMGEFDKSLDYLFKALSIDRDINNLDNESIVLGNIANIYAVKGDYKLSLKYYKESLEVDRKIGSRWSEAIDLGNIGQVYKLQKEYKDSDRYFKMCINIIREMNARNPLSHFLYHRALLLQEMGNTLMAKKLASESLEIAKEIKKENLIKNCEQLLSKIEKMR